VPDSGGASDQCADGLGEKYKARDIASLAAAIRRFSDNGRAHYAGPAADAAAHVRSEEEHFEALFASYEVLVSR